MLEAVAGFGAGVIFLRAATNAAATWRVAAVLVLFVFAALVGTTSAAFFFVGILAFRGVSTAVCTAAAVSDFDARIAEGDDTTSRATGWAPTLFVDASALGALTDESFARADLGGETFADDASLRLGTLAAGSLIAAFMVDVRATGARDVALPAAVGLAPVGLTPVGLAAVDLTAADAAFVAVVACFAATDCFDLARLPSTFIPGFDSGFGARAVEFVPL